MLAHGIMLLCVAAMIGQFLYARHLDRALPPRDRLPVWGMYGPWSVRRKKALYHPVWITPVLAVPLLLVTLFHRPGSARFTDLQLLGFFALAFLLLPLHQLMNGWMLRRWLRKDPPKE